MALIGKRTNSWTDKRMDRDGDETSGWSLWSTKGSFSSTNGITEAVDDRNANSSTKGPWI